MLSTRTRFILSLHAAFFAVCAAFVAQAGEPADDAYKLAIQMEGRGLLHEARFYYGKTLLHRPADKRALLRLGLLQNRLGDSESAQVVLDRLQKICPDCTETQRLEQAIAPKEARMRS